MFRNAVLKKIFVVFFLFVFVGTPFSASEDPRVMTDISSASFAVDIKLFDYREEGIENVDVKVFCVDLLTHDERLFFEGTADENGVLTLQTATDVYDVPELYDFVVRFKMGDQRFQKTFNGTSDYDALFEMLAEEKVFEGENASLFESEWVAFEKITTENYKIAKDSYISFCSARESIEISIETIPKGAEVYFNGHLIGRTPIDYFVYKDSEIIEDNLCLIEIIKEGYENETIEIDLDSEAYRDELMIFIDKEFELKKKGDSK